MSVNRTPKYDAQGNLIGVQYSGNGAAPNQWVDAQGMQHWGDMPAPGPADPTSLPSAVDMDHNPNDPGPVLQPGTAIPGAEDFDITKRGAIENAWKEHGDQYWQPGRTDKFADAFTDTYGVTGEKAPGLSNNAQEAYEAYKKGPTSAGLDPYYQNAKRVAGEDIDKRLASRGMYGSSAADNAIQEAMTNLSAEQANRSADFDLRREALGGSLASGADSSSGAADAAKRAWTEGAGRVASSADTSDINRLNSGFNAAGATQGAQNNRITTGFNAEQGFGDRISAILGAGNKEMYGADSGIQDEAITAKLGSDANKVSADQAHKNALDTSDANFVSTATGGMKTAIPLIPKSPTASPAPAAAPGWQSNPSAQYPTTYPGTSAEPWNQY